ncbi:MAG: prepilin-type N-terminal cleavage/methylation domain-containing protein [Okeania sp. SIO3B5]|uniref:type IV pilin-like G/H family protein n=1 Tax=Okeania sp. SIO3B5 TaxID=2607811 RepID=UPI001401A254|nr:type IV pilin-like G/H family protein [Okeania sp. SIO3B5]NEO57871.1 prepilin-type N-terminal cleavage/methylation domain-containing protein [Okeania sp. SIO3B5]
MKTEFKAKFLQHVAKKKKEEGFTLIELLVVIIIIGILSAIALPSFLSQANKAKQSEAKQYLASISKGQQARYVEKGNFIVDLTAIDQLGLGIKTSTTNYTYSIDGEATSAAVGWTQEGSGSLRGYVGIAFLKDVTGSTDRTSETILCEGEKAQDFTAFTATDCTQAINFTTSL